MTCRAMRGTDFEREFVPQPTDFLCFEKESQQRKRPQDARLSVADGDGGALCFSTVRAGPGTRVGYAAAQTTVPDGPLTVCDARRALWGAPVRCSDRCLEAIDG